MFSLLISTVRNLPTWLIDPHFWMSLLGLLHLSRRSLRKKVLGVIASSVSILCRKQGHTRHDMVTWYQLLSCVHVLASLSWVSLTFCLHTCEATVQLLFSLRSWLVNWVDDTPSIRLSWESCRLHSWSKIWVYNGCAAWWFTELVGESTLNDATLTIAARMTNWHSTLCKPTELWHSDFWWVRVAIDVWSRVFITLRDTV